MNDNVKCSASTNREGLPYVEGPGNGLGYHAHTLNPDLTCFCSEEAVRAAKIANIAYQEGYKEAQYKMRMMMGLSE